MKRGGFYSGVFLLILSLLQVASATDTLVFLSGKELRGHVVFEDRDTVRFRDESGITMTVKKSLLNFDATRAANKQEPAMASAAPAQSAPARPTTLAEVARLSKASRTGHCRVLTNLDLDYGHASAATRPFTPSVDLSKFTTDGLSTYLRETEQTYDHLKEQCRSAGASGAPVRGSATYWVGGKAVSVEGNWADPVEVSRAKQICARALAAEADLSQARDEMARRKEEASGTSSPIAQ